VYEIVYTRREKTEKSSGFWIFFQKTVWNRLNKKISPISQKLHLFGYKDIMKYLTEFCVHSKYVIYHLLSNEDK